MSQDEQIKQLLREGIDAARDGDKATARDKFEQVTELDENNERAWFYLAQVVETDEEKRVCLSNVLVINPNNEKARQQMNRLESKLREQRADEEVIPGISRRQLILFGGGGAVVVLVLLAMFLFISIGNANRAASERAQQTQLAQLATDGVLTAEAMETAFRLTQDEMIGTATPTPRAAVLPPTFTPSPEPTGTPTPVLLPSPGPEIAGNIVAWGGPDNLSNGALEPRVYPVNGGGEYTVIGTELGRDVRYAGDSATRIVYTRYYAATFDFGIEAVNTNGTQRQPIRSTTGVLNAEQPDYCRVANRVVFVGVPEERPTGEILQFDVEPPTQLFIVDLDILGIVEPGSEPPPNATIRLTNDGARYTSPAFSPDCTRVAVIRDDFNSAEAGPDVVVIDVNNPANIIRITSDLDTFIETSPRWSPDGSQIIFAAAQRTAPDNSDIVVASASGTGTPLIPVRHEADDILPVFSPDGAYLAFSSNRAGAYNIFIYRMADGQVFQLTSSQHPVYVGGWRQ